ncbi:sugar phosphate isomerase/epimerase family protein [Vallitalea okinawensis]|uniref:sugar phosphate isomerase/epimerase family protein n=1 Tax=Vallitalea okinawensis TaxID=2078660 RepID=UPI000CFBAB0F|nr:sugar phosphate isomerase/epimerase [Vallitalea okinawensis]
MKEIRIGTLVQGKECVQIIPQIVDHGFESFSLTFWKNCDNFDFAETAKKVNALLKPREISISSLSIFSNPLTFDEDIRQWETIIDHAHLFDCNLVTGFTGRLKNVPIDENIYRFKDVFAELAKRAESKGIKIAFENCDMGGTWETGDWNIAHNPTAWEMMFDAVPYDNLGLEWEPCHQMVSLINPIPQLKEWVSKIFHVHGKDATIDWDIIHKYGVHGPKKFAWHRTPGFGDSNWTNIISILRQNDFEGSIDIEGFHDPIYKGELEMTGQVSGLNYLKQCRGGDFISNPQKEDGSFYYE